MFAYKERAQWLDLARVLDTLFLNNTGRGLTQEHLDYLVRLLPGELVAAAINTKHPAASFVLAIRVKLILVPIFGNFMEVSTILYLFLVRIEMIEISCVHLVKTYCVPSLLYGCEVWNLSCAEYRHLNVVWNNYSLTHCCA